MKGFFIVLEGPDGAGTTTHAKLLAERLESEGHEVVLTMEPTEGEYGKKVREALCGGGVARYAPTPEEIQQLFCADRAEHVTQVIQPALRAGKIVICDRFLDSTIVYQGFGLGIDIAAIKKIGAFATQGIKPGLTIFLDLAVKKGLKHRALNKDRIERRSLAYHSRVRKGYLKLTRLEPKRIKLVKVDRDKLVTQRAIRKIVLNQISKIKYQNDKAKFKNK